MKNCESGDKQENTCILIYALKVEGCKEGGRLMQGKAMEKMEKMEKRPTHFARLTAWQRKKYYEEP